MPSEGPVTMFENMEWLLFVLLFYHLVAFSILIVSYLRTKGLGACDLDRWPKISILIPARNEEDNLPRLLGSILRQEYENMEVLVYDDESDDGTWAVIERFSGKDARIRGIRGKGKPPGWVGKNYALHVLSEMATGDILMFLDADVYIRDRLLLKRMACNMRPGKVITGFLRYRGGGTFVLTVLSYLYFQIPFPLRGGVNGQMWAITREDYRRLEPHRAFSKEVLEDVKIGYWLARKGLEVDFRKLSLYGDVFMYSTLCDAIRGLTKNAWRPFLHLTPVAALLYWVFYLWPFFAAVIYPSYIPVVLIIMAGKFLSDRILLARYLDTLLAPAGIFFFGYVMLRSWVFALLGKTTWKGRPLRE